MHRFNREAGGQRAAEHLSGATAITLAAKAPSGIVIFGPIVGSIINPGTEAQATHCEPTALDTLTPSANERGPRYLSEVRPDSKFEDCKAPLAAAIIS